MSESEKKEKKKIQITLTISPVILDEADKKAQKMGITRAAFIGMAIYKAIQES